jgi:transcriptional regulator with XRE-family HTH domain
MYKGVDIGERESWRVVGERIHRLRKENGLTLRQLAIGCNLSSNAISLVERGKVAPTIETLCKIAHALGVSASALFREACAAEVIVNRAADGLIPALTMEGVRSLARTAKGKPPIAPAQTVCGGSNPISQTALCICGRVVYEVDDKGYELRPGDSLTFIGGGYQHWHNPGEETAIVVMILPSSLKLDESSG